MYTAQVVLQRVVHIRAGETEGDYDLAAVDCQRNLVCNLMGPVGFVSEYEDEYLRRADGVFDRTCPVFSRIDVPRRIPAFDVILFKISDNSIRDILFLDE